MWCVFSLLLCCQSSSSKRLTGSWDSCSPAGLCHWWRRSCSGWRCSCQEIQVYVRCLICRLRDAQTVTSRHIGIGTPEAADLWYIGGALFPRRGTWPIKVWALAGDDCTSALVFRYLSHSESNKPFDLRKIILHLEVKQFRNCECSASPTERTCCNGSRVVLWHLMLGLIKGSLNSVCHAADIQHQIGGTKTSLIRLIDFWHNYAA